MVVIRFHHRWSWSIKLAQFHTGDGLTGDQNDTNWVSVGIGWGIGGSCLFAYVPSKTKKESEALSETDGLCSSEHGLRGIGFGWSPIGYAGFVSCRKVQGNFLLLCSSTNFVGYSYVYMGHIYMYHHIIYIHLYIYILYIYIYIIRSLPLSVVFFAFCHPPPPFPLFRLKTYFQ